MKSVARFFLVAVLAVCVCGCSNREKQLVGKWTGDLTIPESEKDNPMAKMVQGMMGSLSLELKADKTFSMSMIFPIEGTWSVSGDTLSLQATKMMGMSMEQAKSMAKSQGKAGNVDEMDKPMQFTISADGKELKAVPTKGAASSQQGNLVFKKSS